MKLTDLNRDERVAYIAVLREIANEDDLLSLPEMQALRALRDELGPTQWSSLISEANVRFKSWERVLALGLPDMRPEARDLLLEAAKKLADLDGTTEDEEKLLLTLASTVSRLSSS